MITKLVKTTVIFLIFLTYYTQATEPSPLSNIINVDGTQQTYEQLLAANNMAGLSLAVIDNYKVVYSRVAGVKEYGMKEKVSESTAFSAGSISKPVTGIIAAMLAEKGILKLDAPISKYLKRWKLPKSSFTQHKSITISHLLSHTAGTTQTGFSHYSLGNNIPTPIESLNGEKTPEREQAISLVSEPGSKWKYSGGGFVIVQIAIEDVTGKPFAQLAEEMLFKPLGMYHTTMYQHGHVKFLNDVAKAHVQLKVVGNGIPILPQLTAAGMWSNSVDLAKLVIDFQKALSNKKSNVISSWVAKKTTQVQTINKTGGWGLGWMRFRADANLDWFSHSGYNKGIGGLIMATMHDGRAIIVFGNGHHYPSRVPTINTIVNSTIKTLNWKKPIIARNIVPSNALIENITGHYLNMTGGFFSPFGKVVTIEVQEGKIVLINDRRKSKEMFFVGDGKFVIDEFINNELSLSINPANNKEYLTLSRKGTKLISFAMRKLTNDEIGLLK